MLVASVVGCSHTPPLTPSIAAKSPVAEPQTMAITMNNYTVNKLQALLTLHNALPHADKSQAIALFSQAFLDTPYVANQLIGSATTPEQLVIDFSGLDCFTYLDYVQALRTASSESELVENVIQTRYINGRIDFQHRKHFFTDWAHTKHLLASDITAQLSPHVVTVSKHLNRKADGSLYLPGVPTVERAISYIPSEFVDENVIRQLQTGDYIGIYSKLPGLDVTHTGFFIITQHGPVLRHASSSQETMRVIDSPFTHYVSHTPGIVVLRPR
ncbi:DUF1460 domain-containing protein [Serratia sp. S1B]|nr:DUF1460 domain-containing protein [Serratia sp. S1B]